jgi:SAM-dependent methyltransferase
VPGSRLGPKTFVLELESLPEKSKTRKGNESLMSEEYLVWARDPDFVASEAYRTDDRLVRMAAPKGYRALIEEYVYIDSADVVRLFSQVPGVVDTFRGVGVDLGGGVGCISASIATFPSVDRIYCVEIVESAVTLAHPVVVGTILGPARSKVVSVVGDFDRLELPAESLDFAVIWDALHHSRDPVATLRECRRALKPSGRLVVVDRGHNNAVRDEEINRMLGIQYSREWLIKNYRDPDVPFTRREYGEHEYRWHEWEAFFGAAGFTRVAASVVKSANSRAPQNDMGYPEVSVDFAVGAYLQSKICYLLEKSRSVRA